MDDPYCVCYKCKKSYTKRNYKCFCYPCSGGCGKIICHGCSEKCNIRINENFSENARNEIKYDNDTF